MSTANRCDKCGETVTDLDAGFSPALHEMRHDCGGTWRRVRWAVECDGERAYFETRSAAREWAARLRRHPANADIRRFGPYRNVDGIPRVIDLDDTP